MYVTPEKYRTMGFGIDLEDIETVELASVLSRASGIADAYCNVARLPRPHSFLGGVITLDHPEQHPWRLPESDFDPGSRRIYPYHWPVKAVQTLRVKVTNTQYVSIQGPELFVNNSQRYIEVISLLFTGVGLFGAIIPSLGLMRPVAELAYTYGFKFPVVGETIYPTDGRTYRAANQWWDWDEGTAIYINGVVQNSGYVINWDEGTVLFDSQLGMGSTVTVDYTHRLPVEIRDAVSIITTGLLGEREHQERGMFGLASIKVADITIANAPRNGTIGPSNLDETMPDAADLLYGYKELTIR